MMGREQGPLIVVTGESRLAQPNQQDVPNEVVLEALRGGGGRAKCQNHANTGEWSTAARGSGCVII